MDGADVEGEAADTVARLDAYVNAASELLATKGPDGTNDGRIRGDGTFPWDVSLFEFRPDVCLGGYELGRCLGTELGLRQTAQGTSRRKDPTQRAFLGPNDDRFGLTDCPSLSSFIRVVDLFLPHFHCRRLNRGAYLVT